MRGSHQQSLETECNRNQISDESDDVEEPVTEETPTICDAECVLVRANWFIRAHACWIHRSSDEVKQEPEPAHELTELSKQIEVPKRKHTFVGIGQNSIVVPD